MLFELLPYPMHIVITFLKPSKFYITSKNQRPVRSTSGKVGGARLRPFMVIALSKCKKKLRIRDTSPLFFSHGNSFTYMWMFDKRQLVYNRLLF